jgi:hypothetical protein
MESGIWLMLMRRQQPTHSHTASFLISARPLACLFLRSTLLFTSWQGPRGPQQQQMTDPDPDVVGWFLGGQKNTRAGQICMGITYHPEVQILSCPPPRTRCGLQRWITSHRLNYLRLRRWPLPLRWPQLQRRILSVIHCGQMRRVICDSMAAGRVICDSMAAGASF